MKHYRVTFDDDRDLRPRIWRTCKWSEHRFLLNIKIVRIISLFLSLHTLPGLLYRRRKSLSFSCNNKVSIMTTICFFKGTSYQAATVIKSYAQMGSAGNRNHGLFVGVGVIVMRSFNFFPIHIFESHLHLLFFQVLQLCPCSVK